MGGPLFFYAQNLRYWCILSLCSTKSVAIGTSYLYSVLSKQNKRQQKGGPAHHGEPSGQKHIPHHEEEQRTIMTQTAQKINLGQVFTTPSVQDEMRRNDWFRYDVHAAMGKFTAGDWGECFESDADFNDQVLEAGDDKIIGVYDTQAGRVWVMAEPWREATTILFESEY